MNDTTTVGIEVRADGTQEAARDLAVVEASIRKVGKGLGEAAQYIGSAKLEKPIAGLDELAAKCNVSSRHMQNLARMMREVERERAFRQLAQDADLSTLQLAKFRAELGDTRGALATLSNGLGLSKAAMLAWAAAIAFVGKACFDAALEMDRLQKSYRTVMGSDIGATTQLDYIYGLTQKLGLQFQSTAESAKGFFAASVGTRLENDMNDIFKGVTSAGTALSMTQEQMSGVFLAFSQIASKGKLSMEEVNQIAERLPGTFELVSKAMGVNRQEMFKMIEQGKVMSDDLLPKLGVAIQEKFGDKAVEAANSAQGAVNRLSTEWEFFKSSASQTESIVQGINFVTDALKEAKNVLNKNNIVKEMSSKGYKTGQIFTQSYWNGPYTDQEIEAVQKYGEAVINADRQIDLVIAARLQKQREYEAEHQANVKRALKIEQDGMTAWKDATKDLPTFKLMAIDKAEKEALKKLDEWHTRGTLSEKEYQEKKIQIETGYAEKRKSITDKGAKSAEAEANRAAKALAAYDEELAKLTQSSRELEQVKIEEKLAKIAKDAKLPAAEIEKLRKAMEQEADFEWMQDILSYADPAAAAVAKVDKEYEAFLRNVEYLKKTYPAKYTQLMTKAETEHEKALCKAERASEEQNKHLQERLSFYKELEEMSGAFGLSLEVQNRLLDEQMEIFRDADIPENLIQTWRQYKDLMNSHDWADGAQRAFLQYRADATDAAKGAEEAFSSLYSGMDSGWKSAWEQMIETGKVSLSSFRSVFASFLADLMHMAITRPITVQIAGVVSGMLGTGGVAYAAGGSGSNGGGTGGLLGNIPFSSILPDSWTSGATGLFSSITGGINSFGANLLPDLFAPSAQFAANNALAAQTLGYSLGPQTTLLGTLGAAGAGFGLGSLAGSLLFPNQPNISTGAGIGGGLGAAIGSVVPGIGTLLGGTIGSLLGGGIGSLFGGGRKTHASVYGKIEDVGFSRDASTYSDAFMQGAWYDRAGATDAQPFADTIGQAAATTAGTILDLAAALPDEYRKNVENQLASATWTAGRGISGASWNLQWWKEGMAEERTTEAINDMMAQMGYAANQAFAEAGIGDLFTSLDLSSEEGLTKATNAVNSINAISTAIDQIKNPTTEAEQQAAAFVEQMNAVAEAVKSYGLNATYADNLVEEYRTAYVDSYVKSLDEMFNPLSQIEQQAKGYKEAIDGYVSALTTMGASEAQLAQVRGYTQDAIDNITGSLDAAFFPLSDVETQTKATMESLLAYKAALETLGASAEELTRINAAWGKMQSDLLDKARAYVSTTPEVVSLFTAMNAEFDALRRAMELAGSATADLTELEQIRAQAVAALQAQYAESFRQTYAQRYATLTGDTNGLANLQQQASFASELAEIEKTWGKDSEQYRQMQALQDAEAAKQRLQQAQAAYDALQAQLEKQQAELKQLEQQAVQLQIEEIQKLQTASKERIAALEKELSAAQKLHDTWEDVFATAYAKRVDLYQGNTNLDVFGRLDTAQGEFDRLYGLAIGGDADAAKEMAGVASELLGLRGETTANRDDYLDAFYDVDKKLKEVSAYADAQVSDAQKQIDTLQAQLEAENAQYSILVSQLSAQQAALSALNGQTQTLASIQAQIAKLKTEINITIDGKNVASSTVGNAQGDYDDAKDHVDQTKPTVGIYGSKYATEYDLLLAKAKALNRGENLADHQTAGGWTVSSVRSEIYNMGLSSVKDWYDLWGKIEGFAKGGLASGWGIAGENGPELIDFSTPGRVYTAEQTRQILTPPPTAGKDSGMSSELRRLREQGRELVVELRKANARLEKMEKHSKETADGVDRIRGEGIPVVVEATV